MDKIKSYIPVIVVVLVAVALIWGASVYMGKSSGRLSGDEVANKTMSFLNDNILKGKATAELQGKPTEENGLYKIKFKIGTQEINSYATLDGKLFFPEAIEMTANATGSPVAEAAKTIGDFSVTTNEIVKENNKPIVYFFGSTTCPHCQWEKPIIQKVVAKFKNLVSYHENIDSQKDQDVFSKYSDGGVPAIVLGQKYYRVGSGENSGAEQEEKILTALFCKLTATETSATCAGVSDLISQITQ